MSTTTVSTRGFSRRAAQGLVSVAQFQMGSEIIRARELLEHDAARTERAPKKISGLGSTK